MRTVEPCAGNENSDLLVGFERPNVEPAPVLPLKETALREAHRALRRAGRGREGHFARVRALGDGFCVGHPEQNPFRTRFALFAPILPPSGRTWREQLEILQKEGYTRLFQGGETWRIADVLGG